MRTNSPCIEHVEGTHYRCTNHGFDIYTDVLPIHCCGTIRHLEAPAELALTSEARGQYSNMLYMRDPDELTRIITTCLDCEDFDDRCDHSRFPLGCSGRRQWLKALSSVGFRECPKWQE